MSINGAAQLMLCTLPNMFILWRQTKFHCSSGVGHHRFTVRVIGDFTEPLAKECFSKHCVPHLSEVLVPNYEWQKIWEVCGGRPKLLLACGERAAETLNWTDGNQTHCMHFCYWLTFKGIYTAQNTPFLISQYSTTCKWFVCCSFAEPS